MSLTMWIVAGAATIFCIVREVMFWKMRVENRNLRRSVKLLITLRNRKND